MAAISGLAHSRRGIVLICLSTALFAALDTLSKSMIGDFHPVQVTWSRQIFSVLVLFAVIRRREVFSVFRTARPGLQILRAGLLVGVTLSFIIAIGFLPLAEATSIGFTTPLIVTALASVFLRERVGPRRWAAVVAGFCGVLIVVRPDSGGISPAALLVVGLATANAVFLLITRMLGSVDRPQTTMVLTTLLSALATSCAVPFFWTPPTLLGWLQMIAQGLLTGVAQYLVIEAYRTAKVSTLAAFSYFQIIWVTVLGFLAFGEIPGWSTILGAALIVASGIYVFYREASLRQGQTD